MTKRNLQKLLTLTVISSALLALPQIGYAATSWNCYCGATNYGTVTDADMSGVDPQNCHTITNNGLNIPQAAAARLCSAKCDNTAHALTVDNSPTSSTSVTSTVKPTQSTGTKLVLPSVRTSQPLK